jgi:hypothetical protein
VKGEWFPSTVRVVIRICILAGSHWFFIQPRWTSATITGANRWPPRGNNADAGGGWRPVDSRRAAIPRHQPGTISVYSGCWILPACRLMLRSRFFPLLKWK